MHRIDGPGAAPGGVFTEGNPSVGTPATVVTDDWLNAIQSEIENVIVTGGGLALSKPDNQQLLKAIREMMYLASPVGTVIHGYFAAAPTGYLLLNGASVSRSAYADLWAHAQAISAVVSEASWSTNWGKFSSGNGTSTFRLPDLRGEFVRGLDLGRGVDAGRTLGSDQADLFKSHTHGIRADDGGFNSGSQQVSGTDRTFVSYIPQTEATGGTETRPRNVALVYAIRF